MKFIRRLFTTSNIILGFAVGLMIFAVRDFINSTISNKSLIIHSGVVTQKKLFSEVRSKQNNDSLLTVLFKLDNDAKKYSISLKALAVNNLVEIGDSVEFFTRPVTGKRGNFVTSGNMAWYSTNPNELCQIISKGYEKPIVSLGEYQSALRKLAWVGLMLSLVCFAWYFIRRFGSNDWFTFSVGGRDVTIG